MLLAALHTVEEYQRNIGGKRASMIGTNTTTTYVHYNNNANVDDVAASAWLQSNDVVAALNQQVSCCCFNCSLLIYIFQCMK